MTKSDPNDNPFQYMALHHMDDDDDFDLDQDMDENPEDIFADLDLHVEAFLDAFNPDLLEPLLNGHEGDADEHEIFPILVDPWIPDNGWEGVVVWDAVDADEHESVCIFPSPKIELDSVSSARKAREAREAYMKSLLNDPVLVRRATSLMRAACGLDSSGDSAPAPASGDAPSPGNCALEGLAMATAHEAAVDPFESEALGDDSLPAPDGDGFYKTPAQESTVGAPELEAMMIPQEQVGGHGADGRVCSLSPSSCVSLSLVARVKLHNILSGIAIFSKCFTFRYANDSERRHHRSHTDTKLFIYAY